MADQVQCDNCKGLRVTTRKVLLLPDGAPHNPRNAVSMFKAAWSYRQEKGVKAGALQ